MDRGAWWAIVHGVESDTTEGAKSRTRLWDHNQSLPEHISQFLGYGAILLATLGTVQVLNITFKLIPSYTRIYQLCLCVNSRGDESKKGNQE